MAGYEIEVVADDGNLCGEAPLWDDRAGRLIWVDHPSELVYELSPATGRKQVLSRGLMAAGLALTEGNALILAGAGGLHLWRGPDDYQTLATEHEGEPFHFNDILAAPHGRLYAGTYYWGPQGMEKPGKLYLFDANGSVRIADEGFEVANGLGLSPDDRTLYFADSTVRRIYAYDVDTSTGTLSNRRTFVQVPADEGIPDGLTVDREGYIWSAQWYGGQIVRYDPDGKVERRIPLPVRQISSLVFGGPDWTDIYVTTAGRSWEGPYAPPGYDFSARNIGGALYRIRQDIPGRPEYRTRFGD